MRILINNVPWENVNTPNIQDFAITNVASIDSVSAAAEYLDKANYTLFSSTDLTEHAYRASCWIVDQYFDAMQQMWGQLFGG